MKDGHLFSTGGMEKMNCRFTERDMAAGHRVRAADGPASMILSEASPSTLSRAQPAVSTTPGGGTRGFAVIAALPPAGVIGVPRHGPQAADG